jgi:cellulose biosynthesis protein BcsQ
MRTIALYNLQGGVGKTITAVNLAGLAAASGLRVLIWDLDPQNAASWYLCSDKLNPIKAKQLIKGKQLQQQVQASALERLDVLAANLSFRKLDLLLDKAKDGEQRLSELLTQFTKHYDLVVLDCPPSLSRVSENIFAAAEAILVPLIPSPLSLHAYRQILEYFRLHELPRQRLHPFFSMVDRRRKQHRDWLQTPPAELDNLLSAWLPYSSTVEKMSERRALVITYAGRTAVAEAYQALWQELKARLGFTLPPQRDAGRAPTHGFIDLG